jgi:hypothetical protein
MAPRSIRATSGRGTDLVCAPSHSNRTYVRTLPLVMTLTRGIPLSVHGAIEVIAAPAIMAAPFVFAFDPLATATAVAIGVLLMTLALQVEGPRRAVPLSAHAGFDYALALIAMAVGLGLAIATGAWQESIFLVGIGVAQVALTASTRFSVARGA